MFLLSAVTPAAHRDVSPDNLHVLVGTNHLLTETSSGQHTVFHVRVLKRSDGAGNLVEVFEPTGPTSAVAEVRSDRPGSAQVTKESCTGSVAPATATAPSHADLLINPTNGGSINCGGAAKESGAMAGDDEPGSQPDSGGFGHRRADEVHQCNGAAPVHPGVSVARYSALTLDPLENNPEALINHL